MDKNMQDTHQRHFRRIHITKSQEAIWIPSKQNLHDTLCTPDCPNINLLSAYNFQSKPKMEPF